MLELTKPYLLADYVEWLVSHENRAEVSRGDVAQDAAMQEGLDPRTAVNPEDADADEHRQRNQKDRDAQIDDCFDHLEYRAVALGESYLFSVDKDVVRRRQNVVGDHDLVYRFLLASGRTDMSKHCAGTFTELCKLAITRLLGSKALVFNVDAGSKDRKVIGTDMRKAIEYLALKVGAPVKEEFLDDLPPQGDAGGDIVAAFPFEDSAYGHLAFFGQCAATSSDGYWKDKAQQTQRLMSVFQWAAQPVQAMFIPIVYRKASGDWVSKPNVHGVLFFDRPRILKALDVGNNALPAALREDMESALRKKPIVRPRRARGRRGR